MSKEIGKIKSVKFGFGGYQDAMIGFSFILGSDELSWEVSDFWGNWASWGTKPSKDAKWTDKERRAHLGTYCMEVAKLLELSKKESLSNLVGVPIEASFENGALKEWRILTEVI